MAGGKGVVVESLRNADQSFRIEAEQFHGVVAHAIAARNEQIGPGEFAKVPAPAPLAEGIGEPRPHAGHRWLPTLEAEFERRKVVKQSHRCTVGIADQAVEIGGKKDPRPHPAERRAQRPFVVQPIELRRRVSPPHRDGALGREIRARTYRRNYVARASAGIRFCVPDEVSHIGPNTTIAMFGLERRGVYQDRHTCSSADAAGQTLHTVESRWTVVMERLLVASSAGAVDPARDRGFDTPSRRHPGYSGLDLGRGYRSRSVSDTIPRLGWRRRRLVPNGCHDLSKARLASAQKRRVVIGHSSPHKDRLAWT